MVTRVRPEGLQLGASNPQPRGLLHEPGRVGVVAQAQLHAAGVRVLPVRRWPDLDTVHLPVQVHLGIEGKAVPLIDALQQRHDLAPDAVLLQVRGDTGEDHTVGLMRGDAAVGLATWRALASGAVPQGDGAAPGARCAHRVVGDLRGGVRVRPVRELPVVYRHDARRRLGPLDVEYLTVQRGRRRAGPVLRTAMLDEQPRIVGVREDNQGLHARLACVGAIALRDADGLHLRRNVSPGCLP
mmetsp:Transcript_54916/g.158893  ORF Transcript_54916/g.158893 Transcript_54916/m.158893 type:complete len:241 (-) Transcript_54916:1484-2206(-)